ncbi:MAG: hypothetical protein R3F42_03335 [Pseudomonadota bacterium]
MNYRTTLILFLASTAIVIASAAEGSDVESKAACFNDGGLEGALGVFIREGYNDVEVARRNDAGALTFQFDLGKAEYKDSELHACDYLKSFNPFQWVPCKSGTFHIEHLVPRKLLQANYRIVLKDGSEKSGNMSATFMSKNRRMNGMTRC